MQDVEKAKVVLGLLGNVLDEVKDFDDELTVDIMGLCTKVHQTYLSLCPTCGNRRAENKCYGTECNKGRS